MAIKAIFFDCGQVLVNYNTPMFVSELEKNSRSPNTIDVLKNIWQRKFVDLELDKITLKEFYDYLKFALELKDEYSFEQFEKLFAMVVSIDPKMIAIKDALWAQGYYMVMVSNNNRFHMELFRNHYPEVINRFHYLMISSDFGFRKPDERMFIQPMGVYGLSPGECLLIEDTDANLEVFRKLGGVGYKYDVTMGRGYADPLLSIIERRHLVCMLNHLGLLRNYDLYNYM